MGNLNILYLFIVLTFSERSLGIGLTKREVQGSTPNSETICTGGNDKNYTIPNPEDCTKFYMCTMGESASFNCPLGLHFNDKIHVCDWPSNANCNIGGGSKTHSIQEDTINALGSSLDLVTVQPDSSNLLEHSESSTDIPETSTNESEEDSESTAEAEALCGSDLYKGSIYPIPHPNDCTKFYICTLGSAQRFKCPKALHFNDKTHQCDWPRSANCKVSGNSAAEITTIQPAGSTTLKH